MMALHALRGPIVNCDFGGKMRKLATKPSMAFRAQNSRTRDLRQTSWDSVSPLITQQKNRGFPANRKPIICFYNQHLGARGIYPQKPDIFGCLTVA
jgi:hypothetical protein